MKIISSLLGTAVVQVSVDDVLPRRGVLQRHLVDAIVSRYEFNIFPTISPGTPTQPILNFQIGELASDSGSMAINLLGVFPDGDAVTAYDTKVADTVLTDFLSYLDMKFGYRFGEVSLKRLYSSALIVEFEESFVEHTKTISTIQRAINDFLRPEDAPYKLKRLAFGCDLSAEIGPAMSVMHVISQDVTIERRATEPMKRNRFFCVAPMPTEDHARLLERIEDAALER